MLDAGWKEEALAVRAGAGLGPGAAQALGYAEVLAWADGEIDRDAARDRIVQKTRRFSRRQQTWYRKFGIAWHAAPDGTASLKLQGDVLRVFGWDS